LPLPSRPVPRHIAFAFRSSGLLILDCTSCCVRNSSQRPCRHRLEGDCSADTISMDRSICTDEVSLGVSSEGFAPRPEPVTGGYAEVMIARNQTTGSSNAVRSLALASGAHRHSGPVTRLALSFKCSGYRWASLLGAAQAPLPRHLTSTVTRIKDEYSTQMMLALRQTRDCTDCLAGSSPGHRDVLKRGTFGNRRSAPLARYETAPNFATSVKCEAHHLVHYDKGVLSCRDTVGLEVQPGSGAPALPLQIDGQTWLRMARQMQARRSCRSRVQARH